jgi:hypothetical protein
MTKARHQANSDTNELQVPFNAYRCLVAEAGTLVIDRRMARRAAVRLLLTVLGRTKISSLDPPLTAIGLADPT